MKEFGDIYCVLRFGDDLGYKSSTLLSPTDTREMIIPQYKPIVDLVHSYKKPFLLHSCGKIFDVMDDLIDKIGIDVDVVCNYSKPELKEYILDVIAKCENHGGFAVGTGNSIPAYVSAQNYMNMIEIVREYRGDFR